MRTDGTANRADQRRISIEASFIDAASPRGKSRSYYNTSTRASHNTPDIHATANGVGW